MFELTISDHIAAAHFLPGYDGPCKDLHGHTWKIEMILMSENLNQVGLVEDFRAVKGRLKNVLAPLDHVNLNDLPAFQSASPSTENIAKHVYRECVKAFHPHRVKQVRVWESESASVTYYE